MANVELAAVENAIRICKEAIQDMNSSAQTLRQSYQQAGQSFKDQKYHQLGAIVNACESEIRKPVNELFDCINKLESLAKAIREYDETNV